MRKKYTPEFKAKVVLEVLREEKTLNQIASENDIHPNMLGKWKSEAIANLPKIFEQGKGKEDDEKRALNEKIHEVYAQLGEQTSKVSWLKKKMWHRYLVVKSVYQ